MCVVLPFFLLRRDAVNEMALHFLSKMKILVVRDIEREDVEFVSKVCAGTCVVYCIRTCFLSTNWLDHAMIHCQCRYQLHVMHFKPAIFVHIRCHGNTVTLS